MCLVENSNKIQEKKFKAEKQKQNAPSICIGWQFSLRGERIHSEAMWIFMNRWQYGDQGHANVRLSKSFTIIILINIIILTIWYCETKKWVSFEDYLPFQNQFGRMGSAWARYFEPGMDISEDNLYPWKKIQIWFFFWFGEFPEVTPYNEETTFDPMYGFPNGRKERGKSYFINWFDWKTFCYEFSAMEMASMILCDKNVKWYFVT